MTEPDNKAAATEPRETQQSGLASLNARTAKRQQLLLASVGAVLLSGASWFIFGSDDSADGADPKAAQTIETAGLVNRDLSQREFVAVYGNRLDAVTREQKALKEAQAPLEGVEAQLAALKAENQAMRVDGQAAIDAVSAENAALKSQIAVQAAAPPPAALPAYGPQAGGYDARGRTPGSPIPNTGGAPTDSLSHRVKSNC